MRKLKTPDMKISLYVKTIVMAMAATLAGCSGEDELSRSSYPADNVVRVVTNVNDIQTRAIYTNSNLRKFGLSIQNPKNERYCYGNNKVIKTGDVWTPSPQMLWEKSSQEVDIYAYAPYNPNYTGNIYHATEFPVNVSADQTLEDDHSDFLLFKSSGFNPGSDLKNGSVPIEFNHALSLLEVHITFRDEFNEFAPLAADPIKEVLVKGAKLEGTCNFASQSVTVLEEASAASVKAAQTSFTAADTFSINAAAIYSCILIPQTLAARAFSVDMKINIDRDDRVYKWTSTQALTLEAGKKYTLKLIVGKEAVDLGSVTEKRWLLGSLFYLY